MTRYRRTSPPTTQFVVGEVTKNWTAGDTAPPTPADCIGGLFEEMIVANHADGYRLHSWELRQLLTGRGNMTETIVAVFERVKE